MPFNDDQRTPRTRFLLLITAFVIAVLSFGQPLVAYADPASVNTDQTTSDAKKATDNTTADATTPDPSDKTSQTPAADAASTDPTKTPSASGSPSATSSAEPSEKPSETPTTRPTESATAGPTTPSTDKTPSDKTPSATSTSPTPSSSSSASTSGRVRALAISPLDCTGNTIYQIQRPTDSSPASNPGKLNGVAVGSMSGTNPVTATQVTNTLLSGTNPGGNALGVTAGGAGAWALAPQTAAGTGNTLVFTLYSFDVTTEVWTQRTATIDTTGRLPSGVTADSIRSGGIVAGAIDPLSGNFYWASLANAPVNALTVFGWNTTTNTSIGVVANSTLPQGASTGTAGTNGDIAFDAAGNLYVVSNTGQSAALGVIQGPLATTQPATTPTLPISQLTTFSNTASNNYNGIAFNATGDLFVEYSTSGGGTAITKLNPQTGAVTAGPSAVTFSPTGGGVGVDLAACSNPPTLQLAKNVTNRQLSTDQFALAITGGSITQGNTATTSGTATGVQSQTAGPVVARAGTTYTFTETGAGTTTLANYTTTWSCTNQGTVVASGTGTTFTYTPTAGQAILCTFTNSAPRVVVTKTSTATKIVPGQQVPYTLSVQNTGPVAASGVVVTDTLPAGLTFVSSTPACTAAGQVVTCNLGTVAATSTSTINLVTTAANPFPSSSVDASGNVTNPVRVTATGTNCPTASSTDTACTSQAVLPIPSTLTLVKTVTNDNGGTALPTAWTLAAAGPTPISGTTGSAAVTGATVTNGSYTLSESGGPSGYTASAWTCTGGTVTGGNTVVVTPGANPVCTINNNDQQATLTLVKTVTNDNGGTATVSQWTLAAAGPTPISGASGSASVTGAAVNAGTYTLSETGPTGYAPGSWSCTAGTLTGASLVLGVGVSATCTINNNDIGPRLTLVKTVTNDSGGTATVGQWTLTATGPTTISGVTGAAAITNAAVNAGTYTLSETGPAGYSAGAWSCTAGTLTGSSLVLPLNTSATCTINNNDQPATLTLVKTVTNDNGGTAAATAWTLTATGPTTITGATGSAAVTNAAVNAGTYTLSETGPAGYAAGSWSCTAGTLTGSSLVLGLGVSATCTINNNDIGPRLTLVKTVTNDNGGTATVGQWTLTATGPTVISGVTGAASVTNAAVDAGAYALTESGPAGYTAGSWSCTAGTLTGNSLVLPLNTSATCTINNNDQPATLTLVKVVNNGTTGATAVPSNWTLTATSGATTITGPGNSVAVTNQTVNAGTYALSESGGPAGYTASSWSCTGGTVTGANVVVPSGGNVSCTITNTAQQPILTLVKVVNNGTTGGTAVPANWTLSAVNGGNLVSGPGNSASVTSQPVVVGAWVLSESGGPAGYTAGSWSCTGATLAGTTVTIVPGSNATCTITNTAQQPRLTLVKTVTNDNGGTATAGQWTLIATGPTTGITGATGSAPVTNVPVQIGSYALAESGGPAGYAAGAWSCTGATVTGSTVVVALGANATCTINNNDQGPTLTLVKTVTNDNGGTAAATAWTLTATGPTTISGTTGSPAVTGAPVNTGTYTLSEAGPAGYTASSWSCTAGTLTGASLVLPLNTNATCTINNNDIGPHLTLVKTVTNDNGGTAPATAWTLTATGPTTIAGSTGSAAVTGAAVDAGTYALSESGPGGYQAGSWSCTAGTLTGASLVLPLNTNATCTINNNDQPAALTLIKVVNNGTTGATAVPANWTLTATGPTTITGPGNSVSVTNQTVNAGSYVLSESGGPAGYTASAWSCTGATVTGSTVVVPNGGNVACTITNTVVQPTLTLVKVVNNGTTGGTAVPANWTLSAANGGNLVSGPGNSAAVTNQPVVVGPWVLSESGGPAGYTAGAWSCTGATLAGTTVTIAPGSNATCTITNTAQQARLTLVKTVTNDNGGTATPAQWTLAATGGPTTGITGPTGSGTVTNVPVSPGTYTLGESNGPAGYTPSGWTCTAGTLTGANLTLALGQNATCTINNDDQPATLTLIKTVTNDHGGTAVPTDWTLSATGPTTGVTGPVGDPAVTAVPVSAGTYVLSEAGGPAGYTPDNWSCTAGTLTGASLVLGNGVSATCTIDNDDQPATLTLVKTVTNDNGGTAVPTDWTLTATGPTTISGATGSGPVTDATVDAGSYDLTEAGPAGYTAGSWSCTGGSQTGSSVVLSSGVSATCTINNDDQPASLTLTKVVDNGTTGATFGPSDWTLSAEGPTPISGAGGSPDVENQTVSAGTYSLSEENGPAGYTAGTWSCNGARSIGSTVVVPSGGDVSCTITNTVIQPTLTLVKIVNAGNTGDTSTPADWTLTASGPTLVTGPGNSAEVTSQPVQVGDYALSEAGGPDGYTASGWSCVGADRSDETSTTIGAGENVTCTITNSAEGPTLTLIKVVNNDSTGGTAAATDWTLTATGPTTISGRTGISEEVPIGTYTLSESGPDGYDASTWTCTGGTDPTGTKVDVGLNEIVTCTVINTAQQPHLTLVKTVTNDNGGTAAATDWTLSATGPSTINGATGTAPVTGAPVRVGSYDLAESGPTGYTASAWTCTGATLTDTTVTIALGDNATCTITNNDQPAQLTLVKNVDNPDGSGGTAVPADWSLTADGPTPITGTSGSDPVTGATVDAGTYTLTEADGPAGYTAGTWTCTGATASGTTVTVPNGGNVTCQITNTAQQAHLTLVKTVTNDNGGTALPTDWTLTADGPTAGITGPVGDPAVTDAVVAAGDYQLTETGGPAGYTPGDWTCTGATVTETTVTIALGDDATCTIHNNDQPAQLTLVKNVDHATSGDTTPATAWTLTATGPTPISGTTGSTDVTSATVDAGTYDLTETGPAGFTATAWDCGTATITGSTVTVPNGGNVTCQITNTAVAPTLTLVKTVDNGTTGATHTPDEWALTADGPTLFTVTTGVTSNAQVGTYDLSEAGPDGYTASAWNCTGAADSTTSTVQLALNENAICTVTNTARQPHLTLVKDVVNDNGGTALPTDWTLTADGPTPGITGPVGDAGVTNVPVQIGTYQLAETNGPTGYTASAWTCTGATLTDTTVTIALGDNATCTITNNDVLGTWDLAKASDPVSGTTVQPGDLIAYTVTATKTGGVNPVDRVVNDDLSKVLDHATLVGLPAATTGTATITGTTLTWDIPSLSGSQTVRYTVRVDPGAYGITIGNLVTGSGSSTCPPADPGEQCSTSHPTPHYTLTKASDPASGATVQPGDTISYTLTAHNDSDGVVAGAIVTDDLSAVLDNATLGTVGAGGSVSGTTLTWTAPTLQPGDTATLTYTVTVNAGAYGQTLRNVATPGPGGDCTATCSTSHPTPHYTLTKTSDPASGATVQPGDTISYTLTAHNDSDGVVSGAVVTDDLSTVLDNAALGTVGSGGSVAGTTLSWSVPTLQPGDTATLTYTVTVNEGAWGVSLHNVATPGPGGDCTEACSTTHPTPRWLLAKSSDPASGSTVQPGAKITYTLTAQNVSEAVVTSGVATDDLSDVLNHATLDAVPAGATITGTTLRWTVPVLQPGQLATLSYTVTVDPAALGQRLHNVATPGPGGSCAPVGDLGDKRAADVRAAAFTEVRSAAEGPEVCQTTHLIPDWTLTKTSNPASGSTVQPGGVVTYSLTAHNPSAAVVTGAVATDDLGGVLDHATLRRPLPAGATLTGTTLTWTVPTLQPGATARLSYSVTVASDAYETTLTNVVTPGGYGHCAGSCTTTHHTPNKPVPPPPPPPPPHGLPNTGGPSLLPAGIGIGLLLGGGLLVVWSRRRRVS